MLVNRKIKVINLIKWSGHHILWLLAFMGGIATLYYFDIVSIHIPWLPLSVIGTAVAFYVGFKNNQSYDRMWEARKIWGGIVNDSRTWGMMIDGFVSNQFTRENLSEGEIYEIKK
ncbi:MAG: bestrophin family ion channel, partial [Bacteroidota bacterium]